MLTFDLIILIIWIITIHDDDLTDKCLTIEKPWFLANFVILVGIVPNIYY